jgi:hypothetical protein
MKSEKTPESVRNDGPASRVRRVPRGYRGIGHETVGSDILSLVDAILMPDAILGAERHARLRALDPATFYPIEDLLDAFEHIDRRLGPDSMRKIGHSIFKLSHEAGVRANCRFAADIVEGIDGMYHRANRGEDIGGWTVLELDDRHALLEKTTPHHCVVEEGILEAGMRAMGVSPRIEQRRCFRRGADACTLHISVVAGAAHWRKQA